ncbi:MAG: M15 family metallopeptidase [Clostridia bacterium]|nr:M15 family metallopeptidase [Clostridia bacterium]
MKRFFCSLLCLMLLLSACPAFCEDSEGDLSVDEIVESVDLDTPAAGEWNFPVALEDMNPDFVRLANKHYLLDKDYYAKPLVKVKALKLKNGENSNGGIRKASGGTMQLQEDCYQALVALSDAARADGYNLYLKSAYRSWQTQNTMYKNRLKKNGGKDDGWVSKAGASDHQTGLGCDVIPKSWLKASGMNSKMAKEPECIWMAEHCQEYGFIIRYPADKEDVTEINYEPWHLRYVGIPAATYIMENGLCLEEFCEQLQAAIGEYLENGGDRKKVEKFIQEPNGE